MSLTQRSQNQDKRHQPVPSNTTTNASNSDRVKQTQARKQGQ